MGLAVRFTKGKFCPVLVCDTCEEAITDWRRAVAVSELFTEEGAVRSVRVFHSGQCDPGRAPRRDEQARGWQPLHQYLAWLLWNSDWAKKFEETPQGRKLILDVPEPLDFA